MPTNSNAINFFSPAKWVVSKVAGEGTHTTISSAIASASSGDTIVIMPGTYTENPTLSAGINLTAFGSDSSQNGTGNVIINGTITFSVAGSVSISGMQLQTNSAPFLTVGGSAASIVNIENCYLNCTNNTGISFSSSSASSLINIKNCLGDLGTTGIGLYTMSSLGRLNITTSRRLTNSGGSTTASSNSAGIVSIQFATFLFPISTSSIGVILLSHASIDCSAVNSTSVTTAGTGVSASGFCNLLSGSASTLSIGAGTTYDSTKDIFSSSNINVITGAGTVFLVSPSMVGTSFQTNPTTQTGGSISGLTQGTAPSAGFLGERISSTIAIGSAVSLSTGVSANITNISLSPGIWDVSCLATCVFTGAATVFKASINTSSATLGTDGDNAGTFSNTTLAQPIITIPVFRYTFSSTTTVYLVAQATFSTGSASAFGRITAVRVG